MYDIEAPAPRTRLARHLDSAGLDRIQYSVFLGPLSSSRWEHLAEWLKTFFDAHCQPKDRIYALVLDPRNFRRMLVLGEPLDKEWLLGGPNVLFP